MVTATLYCPRLIGREPEQSALLELVTRAASGDGTLALVAGEAGIGKTRFLTEFRNQAVRRARCALVTCTSFAPAPFGPIQSLLATFDSAPLALPGADAPFEEAAAGRARLFRVALDALREAARHRPVVAILDDLQWADTATLEFIQYLGTELAGQRLLLVLAYRTEGLGAAPAVERALARMARTPGARHFDLQPLTSSSIVELLEATAGQDLPEIDAVRSICERSEGNPLFAEELLKASLERGNGTGAPASLRAIVAERLSRIKPRELHLLETAASIGRRFDLPFLERIANDASREELIAFLRLAVEEHFLVENRREPGWFAFRHALVRDAILAPMLLVEAQAIHARIAQELERRPDAVARASELSDHYWHAGAHAECARYARIAGDEATRRHAFVEAAAQYDRALACGIDDDTVMAELHYGTACARRSIGDEPQAIAHYESAGRLFEQVGNVDRAARAKYGQARACQSAGDNRGAFVALEEAAELERLAPDDRLRLRLLVETAQVRLLAGEWDQVTAKLEQALPLLEIASQRESYLFYSTRSGLRSFARGDHAGAHADLLTALEFARESEDPDLISSGLTNLGLDARRNGDAAAAASYYEESIALGIRFGQHEKTARARVHYALVLTLAGRLAEARATLIELLNDRYRESIAVEAWTAERTLRVAVLLNDDLLAARIETAPILQRLESAGGIRMWCGVAGALTQRLAMQGDAARAAELAGRIVATLPREENLCELLLPAAAFGERATAESARANVAAFRGSTSPYVRAVVTLIEAYAAARFGGPGAATEAADAAAGHFGALGMPLLEAEAHALAGRRNRTAALMERCGARRLERYLVRESGARATAKPTLTRREREVGDLARRGFSNRAIADELSLSERTVESHLAAVYAKMGVGSRAELVAATRDEGWPA